MKVNEKYLDFILNDSYVDILEGTTQAGKSITAINTKFLYLVMKSPKKKHIIAGQTVGIIMSNLIDNGSCGLVNTYPNIEVYLNGNAEQKLPHLKIEDNIIYLIGYGDVSKYKQVLGGQFGVAFLDEVNIANMGFVRELFLPRADNFILTLNPSNPKDEIYDVIINRSRPIKKYENDVPKHIWKWLKQSEPADGFVYWFFTYYDNPSLSEERIEKLKTSLLPGTREYQTKILGIRTIGTGLVLPLGNNNVISEEKAKEYKYEMFSCGVDTSYSSTSADTVSFIYCGITTDGKLVILEEKCYNNRNNKNEPFSPSDIAVKLDDFFINCCRKWGITKSLFIDNADIATTTEVQKFARNNARSYYPTSSWKKLQIIDRVNLTNGWIKSENYLIVDHCENIINEHNSYVWDTDKDKPQDGNDHCLNASQYAWIPYKAKIGVE